MEVHVPEGPTHSFRDFVIHIFIVTVGILIALGLDNLRETLHDHRIVREARENFQQELKGNQAHIVLELANTRHMQTEIDGIVADLPELRKHPEQLATRVAPIQPSFYFFSNSRWEAALSTGALGHMSPDEVGLYANENFMVHSYSNLEVEAQPVWVDLETFFTARPRLSDQDVDTGVEKLLKMQSMVKTLTHVGEQLQSATNGAIER